MASTALSDCCPLVTDYTELYILIVCNQSIFSVVTYSSCVHTCTCILILPPRPQVWESDVTSNNTSTNYHTHATVLAYTNLKWSRDVATSQRLQVVLCSCSSSILTVLMSLCEGATFHRWRGRGILIVRGELVWPLGRISVHVVCIICGWSFW